MNILYIASLYSKSLNSIFADRVRYSAFQKFHQLIVSGLIANGCSVTVISAAKNKAGKLNTAFVDIDQGAHYNYLLFLDLPLVKHIMVFVSTFFKVLFSSKNNVVICDILNISLCLGAVSASKIRGIKLVGIVTDMPGLMVSSTQSILGEIIKNINLSYITSFDYYVLLTHQMNEIVNTKSKPYIIMEGLVDVDETNTDKETKDTTRNIIYAGGLFEKYGIKTLIEAFMKIDDSDIRLHLYGLGDMVDDIKRYTIIDSRVAYMSTVSNEEIVCAEKRAFLLVNPRPTVEEFTKYSFPSKNMEYMVSGTPLLTTKLPGMPKEYEDYVFLFSGEDVEHYYNTIKMIIKLNSVDLDAKGMAARDFVLTRKNNITQSERIIQLLTDK